jgi:hypothetical protein
LSLVASAVDLVLCVCSLFWAKIQPAEVPKHRTCGKRNSTGREVIRPDSAEPNSGVRAPCARLDRPDSRVCIGRSTGSRTRYIQSALPRRRRSSASFGRSTSSTPLRDAPSRGAWGCDRPEAWCVPCRFRRLSARSAARRGAVSWNWSGVSHCPGRQRRQSKGHSDRDGTSLAEPTSVRRS